MERDDLRTPEERVLARLLGRGAVQPGQLAFFRRQRFVSVHAFNPARSLSIA